MIKNLNDELDEDCSRSKLDFNRRKKEIEIKCEYCDTYNNENALKCCVCEAILVNNSTRLEISDCQQAILHKKLGNTFGKFDDTVYERENQDKCEYCNSSIEKGDKVCPICDNEIIRIEPLGGAQGPLNCTWMCPSCSFLNKLECKCCDVCFTFREIDDPVGKEDFDVPDISHEKWKCTRCRTETPFDNYICATCKKFAPFLFKWRCHNCSYFNDKGLQRCEKCDTVTEEEQGQEAGLEYGPEEDSEDDWQNLRFDKCIICKKKFAELGPCICEACTLSMWYCYNRFCGTINYRNTKFCCKCELRKGSNVTKRNTVDVYDGKMFVKKWQCSGCGIFNEANKCKGCELSRSNDSSNTIASKISEVGVGITTLWKKITGH